jgi:hypothetical protein
MLLPHRCQEEGGEVKLTLRDAVENEDRPDGQGEGGVHPRQLGPEWPGRKSENADFRRAARWQHACATRCAGPSFAESRASPKGPP